MFLWDQAGWITALHEQSCGSCPLPGHCTAGEAGQRCRGERAAVAVPLLPQPGRAGPGQDGPGRGAVPQQGSPAGTPPPHPSLADPSAFYGGGEPSSTRSSLAGQGCLVLAPGSRDWPERGRQGVPNATGTAAAGGPVPAPRGASSRGRCAPSPLAPQPPPRRTGAPTRCRRWDVASAAAGPSPRAGGRARRGKLRSLPQEPGRSRRAAPAVPLPLPSPGPPRRDGALPLRAGLPRPAPPPARRAPGRRLSPPHPRAGSNGLLAAPAPPSARGGRAASGPFSAATHRLPLQLDFFPELLHFHFQFVLLAQVLDVDGWHRLHCQSAEGRREEDKRLPLGSRGAGAGAPGRARGGGAVGRPPPARPRAHSPGAVRAAPLLGGGGRRFLSGAPGTPSPRRSGL